MIEEPDLSAHLIRPYILITYLNYMSDPLLVFLKLIILMLKLTARSFRYYN